MFAQIVITILYLTAFSGLISLIMSVFIGIVFALIKEIERNAENYFHRDDSDSDSESESETDSSESEEEKDDYYLVKDDPYNIDCTEEFRDQDRYIAKYYRYPPELDVSGIVNQLYDEGYTFVSRKRLRVEKNEYYNPLHYDANDSKKTN
jgi:hypothetical protein